jgi:hypothetical protein
MSIARDLAKLDKTEAAKAHPLVRLILTKRAELAAMEARAAKSRGWANRDEIMRASLILEGMETAADLAVRFTRADREVLRAEA